MKKILFFALPVLVMVASSCMKTNNTEDTPFNVPEGKFTGNFTRYRIRLINGKYVRDTTKVTGLALNLAAGKYQVKGDTTVHAGSKGLYYYDRQLLEFRDSTVKAGTSSVTLPKPHLSGIFLYEYTGSTLKFSAQNDTLFYYYDLKKN